MDKLGMFQALLKVLKSDHFGIEMEEADKILKEITELKSDHFGIEIKFLDIGGGVAHGLKSDHFGIEIHNGVEFISVAQHTKIRPFWD